MLSVNDFSFKQIVIASIKEGDKISFSNDNVIIKDKDENVKHQSSCYRLFLLIVIGDLSITSGILKRAKKYGFTICLMSYSLKVYQMLHNMGDGNTALNYLQFTIEKDYEQQIANHIVANKIYSQINALKKLRSSDSETQEVIDRLKDYITYVNKSTSIQELMGYEGNAAKAYFEIIFSNMNWIGRKPRIKIDYINACLDMGYSILFNFIEAIVNSFGFNVYKGILHQVFYMRKSLVCDLMEPFRPLIDYKVRKAVNLNQIKEEDFNLIKGAYKLDIKKNGVYMKLFLETILEHKEEIFKYIQKFYRSFANRKEVKDYPIYEL